MESAILGIVLDSSVLIAAERRKLTAAQTIEDVVNKVGAVPDILSALTVADAFRFVCLGATSGLIEKLPHPSRRHGDQQIRARDIRGMFPIADVVGMILANLAYFQCLTDGLPDEHFARPVLI